MKYLILKGALGFGDRLECLIMCVKFAIKNNLTIFIDWSDIIWSHDTESFYSYFKLNIPSLKSLDDIPANATVYPPYWKGRLNEKLTNQNIVTLKQQITIGYLDNQIFKEDVLVHSCVGNRWIYADYAFFANVFRVIDPRIIQKVKERQQKYNLRNKIGIHLRGTDRTLLIDKERRISGLNIRMVTSGMLSGVEFIAVSDDIEFVKLWKKRYPQFPVLTEVGALGGKEGVHNKSKDMISISKDQLNLDLLIDFFTLASCKSVISTINDSRFAQEAGRLSKHINQILN